MLKKFKTLRKMNERGVGAPDITEKTTSLPQLNVLLI